jgi:hypothetical protein
MSALAIITQALLASEAFTNIVDSKVYPIMAPQNAARPYTVLHLVDNEDTPHLGGAGRYYRSIVQADHYAEMTSEGAATVVRLGDAAIEALNGIVKAKIAGCVDVDVLLGAVDFTESFLEANTHRRYTQFTCRWRTQPGPPAEVPDESPAPDQWAFEIVAGGHTNPSGAGAGYSGKNNFQGRPTFGALNEEPIEGFPLQACYRVGAPSNNSVVAFSGNVSALLAGKSVWVDGVDYGQGEQYKFTHHGGITLWNRIAGGPTFAAGQSYSIEIR